jgi:tetratricopeptide (TPR) repeat protein
MRNVIRFFFIVGISILGVYAPVRGDTPVEMLQSALDAYFSGRYEESVHFFEQILKVDPKNVRAKEGIKNAKRKRKEQIRQDREQERKAIFVAQDYLSKGKYVEAYDRGREILTRSPNLPDAVKIMKKARAKEEKIIRKANPDSSAFHEAQGDLAYMDGDWFKAVDSWGKVLVFNKDRADLMQRLDLAKKKLEEEQRAERIHVMLDLARAHMQRGFYPDAVTVLSDLLRLDPTNAEARLMLNEARRSATLAHQVQTDGRVQEINQKAMDAFSLGHRKKALSLFNEALKLDPENRLARDYKNRILGLDPSLLDAQTLAPKDPGKNYADAKKFIQENRFVEAIEVLERALKLNPNDLKADQLLADVRGRQRELREQSYRDALIAYSRGDRAGAIRKLEEARQIDPDFVKAKQALLKIMQEGNE